MTPQAGGRYRRTDAVRPGHLQRPADVGPGAGAARPRVASELRHQPAVSAGTALTLFFVYAGLLGLSLASIFLVYTGASITRVFFISAATFGALSLYGYTTQRDLTGIGSFMFMGLIGIMIASLVNMFLQSSGLDWAISVIGVLVFVGPDRLRHAEDQGDVQRRWTTARSPAARR